MKTITLPIFDRPEYLKTTLESISRAEEYEIFASLDYSGKIKECRDVLELFRAKFQKMHILVGLKRKGMVQNAFDNVEWAIASGSHFNVMIEDDLWLSPDFFLLMDWYERAFKYNRLEYSAFGGQSGKYPRPTPDTVIADTYFYGNGWATFTEQWDKWFKPFWFSSEYAQKHFNARGNDWNISGVFREFNAPMLVPTLSRSKHIGIIGANHTADVYERFCRGNQVNQEHLISDWRIDYVGA